MVTRVLLGDYYIVLCGWVQFRVLILQYCIVHICITFIFSHFIVQYKSPLLSKLHGYRNHSCLLPQHCFLNAIGTTVSVITVNPWSTFIRSSWESVHRYSHTLLKRKPASRLSASGEWGHPCWTSTAAGHMRTRVLSPHSSPDSEEVVTLIFMLSWKK